METLAHIRQALRALSDTSRARHSQKFFRTGPGEYAEGDRFLGITVPQTRKIAKRCTELQNGEILELLRSPYHEERLLALLVLVDRFKKGDAQQQKVIYDLYLKNKIYVNNWDLVDVSAAVILGTYLLERDTGVLFTMAKAKNLWERRMAILATLAFIKHNRFDMTLKIAQILLQDREDLIHKAVGWMLREIGKRDLATEETFLQTHYHRMPRTMLRYAIEKFEENHRKQYLHGLR